MIEAATANLLAFVVFLFSVLFVFTGMLETCVYRRYIIPVMVLFMAVILWEQTIPSLLLVFSVPLIYFGYKGQGISIKKENELKEENK